jgi:hypothetical protein
MAWRALAITVTVLATVTACGGTDDPIAYLDDYLAQSYPGSSVRQCRELRDAPSGTVVYCRHGVLTPGLRRELLLESAPPRSATASVCFVVNEQRGYVIPHGWGYPNDSMLSAENPCLPLSE